MARSIRLLEYQQQLNERLQAVERGQTSASLLAFGLGEERCLIELDEASGVVPIPALVEVPFAKTWFLGLGNVRGRFHGIIDFSVFCGGVPSMRTSAPRVLLSGAKIGLNFGLVVTSLLGLRRRELFERVAEPSNDAPWISAEYQDDAGRKWTKLSLEGLAAAPAFREATF